MHIRSILAITAIAFGLQSGFVYAQPRDSRDDDRQEQRHEQPRPDRAQPAKAHDSKRPDRQAGRAQQHKDKPPVAAKHAPQPDRGRGAGPDRRYFQGDRLPADQRIHQYVIDDWRDHHLSAPPRGQQWVQLGADYVLVAIATGIITQIVFGN